ncbi:MAG TPA: hypothetical protein VLA52_00630 [Thermohalobaculum sp.]|nr:hypothetical protein [Thermohalobaculum sp.]
MSETAQQIIAEATEAGDRLHDLDRALQQEMDEIFTNAVLADREMTEAEKARRKEIRAEQTEIADTMRVLKFVTLARLNNSSTVAGLKAQIDDVTTELADDLSRLRNVARYAELAAKITASIARLTGKIAGLVAGPGL